MIAVSLPLSEAPQADTLPPLSFEHNRSPNFIPCLITLDGGHQQQARYVWVDMGVDPCVVGRVRGSNVDYGVPLHAQPDYDAMEQPCYSMDNLWRLKWGSDDTAIFDTSLDYLGDRSLTMEVHHFQEAGRVVAQYKEDIKRLEICKWEVGCLQDVSICCLESTNALEQLDRAQVERHMQAVKHADMTI